jgi:pimeloyl-ACP methyl ester carboxylesterase
VQALHPVGHDLLAFDLRSHGSSDRDSYPNMVKFSEDIRAVVDFIVTTQRGDPTAVAVLGLSVGGAAAIHAAAADHRIRTVVAVGSLANPLDLMTREFAKRHLPPFPVGWLILKYLQLRIGVNFNRVAPVNVIRNATARILLIHGARDSVVPVQDGERLERAANPSTTRLWVVPDRGHSDCHEHPEFWRRVVAHLDGGVRNQQQDARGTI